MRVVYSIIVYMPMLVSVQKSTTAADVLTASTFVDMLQPSLSSYSELNRLVFSTLTLSLLTQPITRHVYCIHCIPSSQHAFPTRLPNTPSLSISHRNPLPRPSNPLDRYTCISLRKHANIPSRPSKKRAKTSFKKIKIVLNTKGGIGWSSLHVPAF